MRSSPIVLSYSVLCQEFILMDDPTPKQKLKNPIKLEDIKKNGSLTEIPLIKQSRLSVMPIDSKSWKILNKMGNI